jgi:hypothetical protein
LEKEWAERYVDVDPYLVALSAFGHGELIITIIDGRAARVVCVVGDLRDDHSVGLGICLCIHVDLRSI